MKTFFNDTVLLQSPTAERLYRQVEDLPIIDYHCHLDQTRIKSDDTFSDIGELWLAGDHYKWRAMRMCGVDERFITGGESYRDKFTEYARIVPQLMGNPLYYWTHLELKQIFGIVEPLCAENAESVYRQANETLKTLSVRGLLRRFRVEYIATTDDPCDDLAAHGVYGDTTVAPTFRPDKAYDPSRYISRLENAVGREIRTAADYLDALVERLDLFVEKGCKITDHGFEKFPDEYANDAEAENLFSRRDRWSEAERQRFLGWLLTKLAKEYAKRGLTMQIHFAVVRNNNTKMLGRCGIDSGFDLIAEQQSAKTIVKFLDRFTQAERPRIVLYTLNDGNLAEIAAVTGAFQDVRMGAAWWFNDTLCGIKRNLETIAEYSALGTHLGMLTDSRSFSSYCRFDFFRRILCDFIGAKVEAGQYDEKSAETLAQNICYRNAKKMIGA